jgi:hypothetical protein
MRPKDIGTRAESMTVGFLRENGFENAERRALHGSTDLGDVTGIPGVVIEVKGGEAAKNASVNQVKAWLEETETERVNAGADIGFLVIQRRQQNVRNWWAVLTAETHQRLMGYELRHDSLRRTVWYCQLEAVVVLLRIYGHGDRIDWSKT